MKETENQLANLYISQPRCAKPSLGYVDMTLFLMHHQNCDFTNKQLIHSNFQKDLKSGEGGECGEVERPHKTNFFSPRPKFSKSNEYDFWLEWRTCFQHHSQRVIAKLHPKKVWMVEGRDGSVFHPNNYTKLCSNPSWIKNPWKRRRYSFRTLFGSK